MSTGVDGLHANFAVVEVYVSMDASGLVVNLVVEAACVSTGKGSQDANPVEVRASVSMGVYE